MEVIIQPNRDAICAIAARIIRRRMLENDGRVVLGLATGETPLRLYAELARMHREEGLDFSRATTFNLDEYVGLAADHPQSYRTYMRRNFFSWVNVPEKNIHIPDGRAEDIPAACAAYERAIRDAGGIDVQVLGIGSDGHVGFNEPSSSLSSRTRIKTLTPRTLRDNARFFDAPEQVPHHVITMGIGTILEAREVLLLAFGEGKAQAVAKTVEGPLGAMMPASVLQMHERARVMVDEAAAADLARAPYYRWVYENKPVWQRV
jgi:glucosamine-6-phosphate deaminase